MDCALQYVFIFAIYISFAIDLYCKAQSIFCIDI